MRQLRRPSVVVSTLGPNGAGGKKRAAQILEFERDGKLPSNCPAHWSEPDVRGVLYAMQWRVCAYCAAYIGEVGLTVDHFRPHGRVADDSGHCGYWWLAYDFENYFLSC